MCVFFKTPLSGPSVASVAIWLKCVLLQTLTQQRGAPCCPPSGMSDAALRLERQKQARAARAAAVKTLNELAEDVQVERVSTRPTPGDFTKLWAKLWEAAPQEHRDRLRSARDAWRENGGSGEFPEPSTGGAAATLAPESEQVASDVLEHHRVLQQTFYAAPAAKKAFRLKSRAFLLTFNSMEFSADAELWKAFLLWIMDRVQQFQASYWSAAMERSTRSREAGRVHLHVYFSWQGPGKQGVDHATTDAWVFKSVRPRVDVNCEARGLHHWLKATQRGHFYCSVFKEGAIYADTNYPPWEGLWAPDPAWVVGLYKQHKLSHDAYLRLSMKLRDGHDRRMASVLAVRKSESAFAFDEERTLARRAILAKARPFKPLPWQIEGWRMSYEEVEERYKMLVLHGPSRTGKSRLARALFGVDRTLVVDAQHAEHPDMHEYKRHRHVAVLLDEVASPSFIVNNTKLLQAHVMEPFWASPPRRCTRTRSSFGARQSF